MIGAKAWATRSAAPVEMGAARRGIASASSAARLGNGALLGGARSRICSAIGAAALMASMPLIAAGAVVFGLPASAGGIRLAAGATAADAAGVAAGATAADAAGVAVGAAAADAGTSSSAPDSGEVLYTPDDLMFLTHMIVHHEQALELTALVPSRGQHPEFIKFARYLDGAQRAEIDQMKGLLELAAQRGIEIPHHEMTGDPPMAGMLSKAQMKAVAAATGAEFERLWLEGMIYHHEGALDMARAQQRRQFESGRRPYGIDTLADDIIEVQRGEINKMKTWLQQWHLTR